MAGPLALTWDLIAKDGASAVFKRVAVAADETAVATKRAATSTATASAEMSAASERGAKSVGASAAAVGGAFKTFGKNIALVGVVTAAVSVKMAGDFQQNTNVLVTAAGESVKNLALIRKGILDIAVGTGTKWQDLTTGIYGVEKAGFRGADALKILKAAAQGAREEGANLATVTAAMTSVMASYHLKAVDSVMVMNEMKTAAGEAKTTMELFAGSLSTVLPLASANKISFADIAGSLASLTQHGTSADEAAQELAFTMRGLAAPSAIAVKEMAALGISSLDVATKLGDGKGGRGLAGTLNYLSETVLKKMGPSGTVLLDTFNKTKVGGQDLTVMLNAMTPAMQKYVAALVSGKQVSIDTVTGGKGFSLAQENQIKQWQRLYKSVNGYQSQLKNGLSQNQTFSDAIKKVTGGANGLNAVLQLTGESMVGTNGRIKAISDSAASAGTNVSGWASTQKLFNVQMDQFKQEIDRVFITLGSKLLPIIQNVVKWIGKHIDGFKEAAKVMGVLAAAAVAVAFPLSSIGVALVVLYNKSETFRDVVRKAFGAVADFVHDKLVPAFKAAADWVVDHWPQVQRAFVAAWNMIRPVFDAFGQLLKTVWDSVLKPLVQWVQDHWSQISTVIKAVFTVVAVAAKIVAVALTIAFKNIAGEIKILAAVFRWLYDHVVKPVWDATASIVSGTWNFIKPIIRFISDAFTGLGMALRWAWDTVLKPVFGAIKTAVKAVWDFISPIVTSISAAFTAIGTALQWAWDHTIGPILRMISDAVKVVSDAIDAITGGHTTKSQRKAIPFGGDGGGGRVYGKARGGPVAAGHPYIVGELRPELFVPNVSGRIIPNVPADKHSTITVNQTINNPVPETASVSGPAGLRRAAYALGR